MFHQHVQLYVHLETLPVILKNYYISMESGYEMRISFHPVSSGKVYNKPVLLHWGDIVFPANGFIRQWSGAIIHSYPLFTSPIEIPSFHCNELLQLFVAQAVKVLFWQVYASGRCADVGVFLGCNLKMCFLSLTILGEHIYPLVN